MKDTATGSPRPLRPIEIVCHRGANEYAPENTYASATKAIELGAHYVEIDVNASRDGELFLFHGPELEYTTDGVGLIGDLTAAEIDGLDAGSWFGPQFAGERVPRLEPFLDWIRGRAKLFFDVKGGDLARIVDLVYAADLQKECFFWFRRDDQALVLRAMAPDLALKINVRSAADVQRAHSRFGAEIVEVGLENLSQQLIDACRDRQMRVMVYQPRRDEAAFRAVLDWDVDLINLNHPDLFSQVLDGARGEQGRPGSSPCGYDGYARRDR